jgi:hypothetical protein
VKRAHRDQERLLALRDRHAPRRDAATVAHGIHRQLERSLGIAGRDEVGVQRVGDPTVDRPARGEQRLRDELPAEHAIREAASLARRAEPAAAERREVERAQQALERGEDRALERRIGSARTHEVGGFGAHGGDR